MNYTTRLGLFGLTCALTFTSTCSTPHAASPTPGPADDGHEAYRKPGADVTVEATLAADGARVMVRFDADAHDAMVRIRGVDGLVVTRGGSLDAGDVAQGDVRMLDVTFTPGEGRSHLVVAVEGTYASGTRSRVASFAVGDAGDKSRERVTGEGPERVRLMPVRGR